MGVPKWVIEQFIVEYKSVLMNIYDVCGIFMKIR